MSPEELIETAEPTGAGKSVNVVRSVDFFQSNSFSQTKYCEFDEEDRTFVWDHELREIGGEEREEI